MFYAQHQEDIKISKYLFDFFDVSYTRESGLYIDVGAWEPTLDSVTKHFYERGWCGINIEPVRHYHEMLVNERSRDINVRAAVSDSPGRTSFTHIVGTGLSTFVESYRDEFSQNRQTITEDVNVLTLSQICEMFFTKNIASEIDFLKIDVEGWERNVLLGNDWKVWRPKILCIEATKPGTQIPTWQEWEDILIDARYEPLEFDLLNKYYRRLDE